MSKKPATIFDFITGVTHKKKNWNDYSDIDQKKFSPFIVNRWLSMRQELIEIVNAFQHFTIGTLSPKDTYRISQSEVSEYIGLMNKEKCDYILTLYGYSNSDKKRLLKGIK